MRGCVDDAADAWVSSVRELYPHADKAGKFTVFNIGGNKYRLIAVIHFNRGEVYVRHLLTHEDYKRMTWRTINRWPHRDQNAVST